MEQRTPSAPDAETPHGRVAWIDATAGIAGDMLLGALVDAGADLDGVQHVLDALIPGSVRLAAHPVDRGGQRATKIDVEVLAEDPPHRTWASIRAMLEGARGGEVPARTIELALATFSRLAAAEGAAHGMPSADVHFHEVGALDSLADVIGACEAWRQLGITRGVGSVIAVGSGRIRAAHGDIPVPVPAVARLAAGWPTVAGELLPPRAHGHSHGKGAGHAHGHGHSHQDGSVHAHGHGHGHAEADGEDTAHGPGHDHDHDHGHGHHDGSPSHAHTGDDLPEHMAGGPHAAPGRAVPPGVAPGIGELATPTGVALVRALAATAGPQPALVTETTGIGAGTKDTPGRPNVVRVIIGTPWPAGATTSDSALGLGIHPAADVHATPRAAVQLEANLDDLDPRLWPGVLGALLEAGALDAWLTPVVMKHGRPGVTVHVLAREEHAGVRAEQIIQLTGTLGVRMHPVQRLVRTRSFAEVEVLGGTVRVKIARDDEGRTRRAEPEFRDVQRLARERGITEREALDAARAAARHLADGAAS